MVQKYQNPLQFGKESQQDALRAYRAKLEEVWCITSQTTSLE